MGIIYNVSILYFPALTLGGPDFVQLFGQSLVPCMRLGLRCKAPQYYDSDWGIAEVFRRAGICLIGGMCQISQG